MLAGKQVEYVTDTPPRDFVNVARNVGAAWRLLKKYEPTQFVTNGAGIALSFAPLAAARGISTHYIECSARTEAPSLTGKVLERVPRVRLYAQDPQFAHGRWRFEGSVFDPYVPADETADSPINKIVVTVGSLGFSFSRLVERLRGVIPADAEVLLQLGVDAPGTVWPGARIEGKMPPDELSEEMASADVVIAHSGIGSALAALDAGRMPVLVPRLKRFGEHVDDHQGQIARTLERRGLAIHADASAISADDLRRVAGRRVIARHGQPFILR
jgi:UDP-N-acetylglucosamine transferase subunit ALG13